MDFSEFLVPVPYELKVRQFGRFQVGDKVRFDLDNEVDENAIVLISTNELQEYNFLATDEMDFLAVREHLYGLALSNWQRKIYDLGNVQRGSTFEDSCFALHQIISGISETGATIILLGGSQSLNYILYKALNQDLMKVGSIDIKLDIDAESDELNQINHITKMILDETHRLLEYKNIGSQQPYVAKEEHDILEQLNFEDLRLGKLIQNFHLAEPVLRDLHLLSVDMGAMQLSSFGSALKPTSNGLNEREICGLMNYAGLNKDLKVIHLSNFVNSGLKDNILLAEMLWYYIEAKNNLKSDAEINTYRVQSEEGEIVFLHSKLSDRWWIQASVDGQFANIPCNESDYKDALNGEIPNKWLKFYKKFY